MKKYIITFLFSLVVFFILGGVFGTLVFLPEMTSWYKAFPNAVRETPDFVSGFIVGLVQLIGAILLVDKLKIIDLKSGAIFGIIYSVALWLIIDLQMVSTTNIVTYRYVGLDALLSAFMGAAIGIVVTWSLKKYA